MTLKLSHLSKSKNKSKKISLSKTKYNTDNDNDINIKIKSKYKKGISKSQSLKSSIRKYKTKSLNLNDDYKLINSIVIKKIGGIEQIRLLQTTTQNIIDRFKPINNIGRVMPKVWELPNRKRFFEWVLNTFEQYELGSKKNKELTEKLDKTRNKARLININNTQQIIRDFMQGTGPYRGMLLYYALGVGKSCSGIAVSEAIQTLKEVLFISKAALEDNFKDEITKCGADYMTLSNFWVFSKCETETEKQLAAEMHIPESTIQMNNGVYFIDSVRNRTIGSNFDELSNTHKDKIKQQIYDMINNRFKFLHMDDTRIGGKITPETFNNRVVIVDEAHNLVRRMTSGRPFGEKFYECMMEATNSKFVFLTGTPLINKVFETSRLFNILRGYMPFVECRIKTSFDIDIDYSKIKYTLQQNPYVDQIIINKTAKTIKITRNPTNFITKVAGIALETIPIKTANIEQLQAETQNKETQNDIENVENVETIENVENIEQYGGKSKDLNIELLNYGDYELSPAEIKKTKDLSGVQYTPHLNITDDEFSKQISTAIENLGYKLMVTKGRETCLPVDEEEFNKLFYNPDLNKLKKIDVFKRRIAGLTSYYEYQDPTLFPTLKPIIIRKIPMSEYQLSVYDKARHEEIMKDKKRRQKSKNEDQALGSYRLNSRFACTFVFPEETGSPFDGGDSGKLLQKLEETRIELENYGNADNAEMTKYIHLSSHDNNELEEIYNDHDINDIQKFDKTGKSNKGDKGDKGDKGNKSMEKIAHDAEKLRKRLEKTDGEDLKTTVELTEKEARNKLKTEYLDILDREKARFLDMNNGSLERLSPKYKQIILDILASPGKCYIYSQFLTLVGLNTLALALEQTGIYIPLELIKRDDQWEMKPHKDDHDPVKRKKRYVFFTGNEDMETRNINRLIYNNEWNSLNTNCDKLKTQLKEISPPGRNNLYGEVVQLLFGSMSSAEGLNLKGVRTVCIMEPYWQSVLIEQVIGRARRTKSHIDLPESERNVQVYIYMSTITPEQIKMISHVDVKQDVCKFKGDALGKYNRVVTSDEYLYIIAMRKKEIIDKVQLIMKESAADCTLNYRDNKLTNPNLSCMDYEVTNRDDYLYLPNINDNIDLVEISKEKMIAIPYTEVKINNVTYYYNQIPGPDGKIYLYDEGIQTKARIPKPVGIVVMRNGRRQFALYPTTQTHKKTHKK